LQIFAIALLLRAIRASNWHILIGKLCIQT
jgi:hypothetical protein